MVRVVSVIGLKKSGKTTVVERLVRALTRRSYLVGTVKSMYHTSTTFTIDVVGKDTYRHREAGASFVIAQSDVETSYIQRHGVGEGKKSLKKLLALVPEETDYLVCEGLGERLEQVVEIVCLKTPEHWEETQDARKPANVIALSGIIANQHSEFRGFRVFNVLNEEDAQELVGVVEETSVEF